MLIKANPEKISTIIKCPIPKKRAWKSLGYYRKCVQNDSRIAKLLTKYLQGQNGKVSKKHHLKLQYDSAVSPFNGLIESLIAQRVSTIIL